MEERKFASAYQLETKIAHDTYQQQVTKMPGNYQSMLQVHEGPVPLVLRIEEQLENALKFATKDHSYMVGDSGTSFYEELAAGERKEFDRCWERLPIPV